MPEGRDGAAEQDQLPGDIALFRLKALLVSASCPADNFRSVRFCTNRVMTPIFLRPLSFAVCASVKMDTAQSPPVSEPQKR